MTEQVRIHTPIGLSELSHTPDIETFPEDSRRQKVSIQRVPMGKAHMSGLQRLESPQKNLEITIEINQKVRAAIRPFIEQLKPNRNLIKPNPKQPSKAVDSTTPLIT